MRDMTTAEFAKANLAALEEPVKIRRYTKVVGTYYPESYIESLESVPQLPLPDPSLMGTEYGPIAPGSVKATAKIVEDLTEEVKRLKKQLAARPMQTDTHPMKDVFAGLADQDREFFERKLGKAKK